MEITIIEQESATVADDFTTQKLIESYHPTLRPAFEKLYTYANWLKILHEPKTIPSVTVGRLLQMAAVIESDYHDVVLVPILAQKSEIGISITNAKPLRVLSQGKHIQVPSNDNTKISQIRFLGFNSHPRWTKSRHDYDVDKIDELYDYLRDFLTTTDFERLYHTDGPAKSEAIPAEKPGPGREDLITPLRDMSAMSKLINLTRGADSKSAHTFRTATRVVLDEDTIPYDLIWKIRMHLNRPVQWGLSKKAIMGSLTKKEITQLQKVTLPKPDVRNFLQESLLCFNSTCAHELLRDLPDDACPHIKKYLMMITKDVNPDVAMDQVLSGDGCSECGYKIQSVVSEYDYDALQPTPNRDDPDVKIIYGIVMQVVKTFVTLGTKIRAASLVSSVVADVFELVLKTRRQTRIKYRVVEDTQSDFTRFLASVYIFANIARKIIDARNPKSIRFSESTSPDANKTAVDLLSKHLARNIFNTPEYLVGAYANAITETLDIKIGNYLVIDYTVMVKDDDHDGAQYKIVNPRKHMPIHARRRTNIKTSHRFIYSKQPLAQYFRDGARAKWDIARKQQDSDVKREVIEHAEVHMFLIRSKHICPATETQHEFVKNNCAKCGIAFDDLYAEMVNSKTVAYRKKWHKPTPDVALHVVKPQTSKPRTVAPMKWAPDHKAFASVSEATKISPGQLLKLGIMEGLPYDSKYTAPVATTIDDSRFRTLLGYVHELAKKEPKLGFAFASDFDRASRVLPIREILGFALDYLILMLNKLIATGKTKNAITYVEHFIELDKTHAKTKQIAKTRTPIATERVETEHDNVELVGHNYDMEGEFEIEMGDQ